MATLYVGSGGNDANSGLTWALRKLTLNGAEDTPVAAGDTVYVGPGVYREMLTVDVDGTAGAGVISYIGDYDGSHTDGVGGVVRITGSDNDQTATRQSCISAASKSYRTFRGFLMDGVVSGYYCIGLSTACTNVIIEQCAFTSGLACAVYVSGAGQSAITISNSFMHGNTNYGSVYFTHSAAVDDCAHAINNVLFITGSFGIAIYASGVSGATVKNCTFWGGVSQIYTDTFTAGQTMTVNNCVFVGGNSGGLYAAAAGQITENYNNLYAIVYPRTNVSTGANSNTYLYLPDLRWFFELANGGSMLSPFDLASYSQLVNVAGTSPTTADMRGTTVQGAQREWGALEYDSTLDIEAGTSGGGVNMPRVRVGH